MMLSPVGNECVEQADWQKNEHLSRIPGAIHC